MDFRQEVIIAPNRVFRKQRQPLTPDFLFPSHFFLPDVNRLAFKVESRWAMAGWIKSQVEKFPEIYPPIKWDRSVPSIFYPLIA